MMKKHKIFLAIIYAIVIIAIWFIKFDPQFLPYKYTISITLTIWMLVVAYITLKPEDKHGLTVNKDIYWCDSVVYCTMFEFPNDKDKIEIACLNCSQVNKRVDERILELKELEL